MKVMKFFAFILAMCVFIDAYGALYTVKNSGDMPITVKLDLVSNNKFNIFSKFISEGTLTAKNLKPGEMRQLDAGGGKVVQSIYLLPAGEGKNLDVVYLSNGSESKDRDYRGKYTNEQEGDRTIEFVKYQHLSPSYSAEWKVNVF